MRLLKLNDKFISKPAAKVLVRTEPETLKLGTTWVHQLDDGEHDVADQQGIINWPDNTFTLELKDRCVEAKRDIAD